MLTKIYRAFAALIIRLGFIDDFFSSESSNENRTAWSNEPKRLIASLEECQSAQQQQQQQSKPEPEPLWHWFPVALLVKLIWSAYCRLRTTHPLRGVYPSPGLPKVRASASTGIDETLEAREQDSIIYWSVRHFKKGISLKKGSR